MDESSLQKREQQPQPAPPTAVPATAEDLRASDADRDRIAEILREALAEGRLTAEEHAERIEAAYRARTVGALQPLVRDLPATAGDDRFRPPAPAAASGYPSASSAGEPLNLVAILGGATRKGRWRVGRRTNAFACFGGVEIDLTEAVFDQRETVINTVSVFGGTEITVPENVTLRCTGTGIFGGFDVDTHESDEPDAPVVVITGIALFGGTSAKRRAGKRLRSWSRGEIA